MKQSSRILLVIVYVLLPCSVLPKTWKDCTAGGEIKSLKKNATLIAKRPDVNEKGWPCAHGGSCLFAPAEKARKTDFIETKILRYEKKWLKCQCIAPYKGQFCEEASCKPNPCQNGGKCGLIDTPAGPVTADLIACTCPPTHTGQFCESKAEGKAAGGPKCLKGKKLKGSVTCVNGKCKKRETVVKTLRKYVQKQTDINPNFTRSILLLANVSPGDKKLQVCECKPGYFGLQCNNTCVASYGEYCRKPCGKCSGSPCSKSTGKCKKCLPGHKMPYCLPTTVWFTNDTAPDTASEGADVAAGPPADTDAVLGVEGSLVLNADISQGAAAATPDTEKDLEYDVYRLWIMGVALNGQTPIRGNVKADMSSYNAANRGKRNIHLRQAGGGDVEIPVDFQIDYPASVATPGTDLREAVAGAMKDSSGNFRSNVIPGLSIDADSIRVENAQLRGGDASSSSLSVGVIAGAAVGCVCLVAVSVLAISTVKKKQRQPQMKTDKSARSISKRGSKVSKRKSSVASTAKSLKSTSIKHKYGKSDV